MGGATEEEFLGVFDEVLGVLRRERLEHFVIGGIAAAAVLKSDWSVEGSDIDLFMTSIAARAAKEALADEGFATSVRDESWIYKAAKPDVTTDLIFESSGQVRLDDEMVSRSQNCEFRGRDIPTLGVEDLVVMKALAAKRETAGHWWEAIDMLRRFDIDWGYLVSRSGPPRRERVAALLLYAESDDVHVPAHAVREILDK